MAEWLESLTSNYLPPHFWHSRSLWPWPLSQWPQNKKGHLLVMVNLHVKYENFVIKIFKIYSRSLWLDFWSSDIKFNWGHLLVISNQHVKHMKTVIYSFHDRMRKPLVYRPTVRKSDWQIEWLTIAKQYSPSSKKKWGDGGINR